MFHQVDTWLRCGTTRRNGLLIEYVRRTSHGKDWMNPDEVERHLMNGSRAAKLALLAAKEHGYL